MEKGCGAKCFKCDQAINFASDLFVCLGTYEGDRTVEEKYFHMECWRKYFDEKAREKAEVVVNKMQEIMMPIAKQMTDKLKNAIDQANDDPNAPKIINI